MSFYTALSGLNAAQTDISVTSNNIANVGTLGFQGSRAEFADIFSNSPLSRPTSQVGTGVQVARIGVDFSQGAITATGNVLDLSLQGPGFFQVQLSGESNEMAYTRAGAFNMDSAGYVTNAAGHFLTVFPTADNGDPLTTSETSRLHIPQSLGMSQATGAINMAVQMSLTDNAGLGTQAAVPAAAFDAADSSTYAYSTSVPVLDGEGNSVPAKAYFVLAHAPDATDPTLTYEVQLVVDGELAVPPAGMNTLTFDEFGHQTTGLTDAAFSLTNRDINLNLTGSEVSQKAFEVLSVKQDGKRMLDLSTVEVRENGIVWATYGGEETVAVGRVAVANFGNLQGLTMIGSSTYLETRNSGPVNLGLPGSSGFGSVRSGSVERANVDLTEELVNLIMAQRNYQASAKALETTGQLAQTVMNMRS